MANILIRIYYIKKFSADHVFFLPTKGHLLTKKKYKYKEILNCLVDIHLILISREGC